MKLSLVLFVENRYKTYKNCMHPDPFKFTTFDVLEMLKAGIPIEFVNQQAGDMIIVNQSIPHEVCYIFHFYLIYSD